MTTKHRFIVNGRVTKVEERMATVVVSGTGDKAVTQEQSTGWWIVAGGLAWGVGKDEPKEIVAGQTCRIILEIAGAGGDGAKQTTPAPTSPTPTSGSAAAPVAVPVAVPADRAAVDRVAAGPGRASDRSP